MTDLLLFLFCWSFLPCPIWSETMITVHVESTYACIFYYHWQKYSSCEKGYCKTTKSVSLLDQGLTNCVITTHRVHTEWQRRLSGVHSIMMEKISPGWWGCGMHAHPLSLREIHNPLFHRYAYVLCGHYQSWCTVCRLEGYFDISAIWSLRCRSSCLDPVCQWRTMSVFSWGL